MERERWKATRRDMLKLSAALGAAGALSPAKAFAQQPPLRPTPDQILGPFYPVSMTPNRTGDLTRIAGGTGRAKGQVIVVTGRVLNVRGEPIRGARVEVWQANAAGRYAHPSDTNPAPLDPNFEGFGVLTTDAEGRYEVKTIKPAAYPAGPTTIRPAHIHFDVVGRQDRVVTQMYFDGDRYNETDRFLQSLRNPGRLIVKLQPAKGDTEPDAMLAVFDIVLANG